jgi:secreted PhoX family phosphatase
VRSRDDSERVRAARRRFLQRGGALGVAALSASPLAQMLAHAGEPAAAPPQAGYGRLRPVRDLNTGLPLLRLPEGFSYRTFGWTGEALADGTPTPPAHDGMGVVRWRGDIATVIRNHEVVRADGAFGPSASHYDPLCGGGTVTFEFDQASGEPRAARASLSGTLQNCAGGTTPWHSWLSCEEFVSSVDVAATTRDGKRRLQRDHGFVFEVPADGVSSAEPLVGLGQFRHEAASVHAPSGHVYLTEDMEPVAGFYRFIPDRRGELARGGRLQMLKVAEREELRFGLKVGQRFQVEWVPIEHPERGYEPHSGGIRGVQRQGLAQQASRFTRLEGCIATRDEVFFTATNGGDAACGQVFAYYPQSEELMLVYESPDPETLDYPDNVVVSPRGGLVVCQDSKGDTQHLYGLTRAGELFTFARNNVMLDGGHAGFVGDFRDAEWAGVCFSPDGRWLLANVYRPGFTVAITGPWRDGLI